MGAALLWGLLSLGGCPQVCDGPGCDALYDGALLAVHQGRALSASGEALNPTTGWLTIEGSEDAGPDWSIALGPGVALAGAMEPGRVWALTVPDEATASTLDALAPPFIVGEDPLDAFGFALDRVPDMDGDGRAELIVGAPDRQGGDTDIEAGAVYLFSGLGGGWDTDKVADQADLIITAEAPMDHLGRAVAGCEDLDGDGLGDALIASGWSAGVAEDGAVIPLAGGVLPVLSSAGLVDRVLAGEIGAPWSGEGAGDQLGRALSCRHELQDIPEAPADGRAEMVIGAPFAAGTDGSSGVGAVYVLTADAPGGPVGAAAALTLRGLGAEGYFGAAVASGDLDGDGLAELAVGAPGYSPSPDTNAAGRVTVYAAGSFRDGLEGATWRVTGQTADAHLGSALQIADLNGDGYGDLLAGAPRDEPAGRFAAGTLYVFAGEDALAGWPEDMTPDDASATWQVAEPFLRTGGRIAAGDTDGDGRAELGLIMGIDPN